MKRQIITNPNDARFLLQVPTFVVDIETNTQAPAGSEWPRDTFGLSYCADITTIGLYAPGHNPVVLDNTGYPEDVVTFIRQLFTRKSPYTVIGHNLIFDLRSLGGHFGFLLPHNATVYDTKVMSVTLLLAEPEREKSKSQLTLKALVERFDLFDDDEDRLFYAQMKNERGRLHELVERLQQTPADSVLWRYTRGFPRFDDFTLPSTEIDQQQFVLFGTEQTQLSQMDLSGHAQDVLFQYSAMDVIFPYRLYQLHTDFAQKVCIASTKLADDVYVPKWTVLPEIVKQETENSWVSANLAIKGVRLDIPYAEQKRREWADRIEAETQAVLSMEDPTTPHDLWWSDFQTLLWYKRVLDAFNTKKGTFPNSSKWVNWSHTDNPYRVVFSYLVDFDEAWQTWLTNLDPDASRAAVKNSLPKDALVPEIDLIEWVRQTCFADQEATVGTYLAKVKTDWLTTYYTQTSPMPASKMINSDAFKTYHLFVVCGIELPTTEELEAEADLTTDRFRALLKQAQEQIDADPSMAGMRIDLQALALRSDTLSLGKKAITFYLKRDLDVPDDLDIEDLNEEDLPEYMHFAKLMQAEADFNRATEFLLHSSRDNRIHPLVDRGGTRTHRYSSTNPNLQNINVSKFKGFLLPDFDDHVLIELDYSNAENRMGAMIAGDDAFAYATMAGDFHMEMLKIYRPALVAELTAKGEWGQIKKLRKNHKKVTFGIPYGAGPAKIARSMKISLEEAKAIIDARKAAFPRVEQRKKEVQDNCSKRFQQGFRPAYVPLWTGNRVIVPVYPDKKTRELAPSGYKTWNYLQQGGVAEMVSRAIAKVYRMLEEKGYKTRLVLNVHDSLILSVAVDEWPTVVQECIQIMCSEMPMEQCQRTLPVMYFATEVGPENAFKWGWRHDREYPLSLEHFVNQWGYFRLPDEVIEKKQPKDREAPCWNGPIHEGWTLEGAIEEERARRARIALADETMDTSATVQPVGHEWFELGDLFTKFMTTLNNMIPRAAAIRAQQIPAAISYVKDGGVVNTQQPLAFPEKMIALKTLLAKGHTPDAYQTAVTTINDVLTSADELLQLAQGLQQWKQQYDKQL